MANMWYSPEHGGFVTRVAGTDRVIPLNGQEYQDMKQSYHDNKNAFRDTIRFDPNKDYSKDYGLLFGAESDTSNPLYYDGPNANWRHAMHDRADQRRGGLMGTGWYEGSTSNMDRGFQTQMAKRNNVIESLMNQGYSASQLNAMMAGKRNILNEDPDNASGNWFNDNFQRSNGSNKPAGSNSGMLSQLSNMQEQASEIKQGGMLNSLGDMREKIFQSLGKMSKQQ